MNEMNKWKVTSVVLFMAVLTLSAVVGHQILNKPSEVKTEEPIEPSNSNTEHSNDVPEIVEKPKFHIYDVEAEGVLFNLDKDRVSFKVQNLGNVNATEVVVNFTIKLGDPTYRVTLYNGSYDNVVPFVWVNDTMTIDVIESKETNEYYIDDMSWYFWLAGVDSTKREQGGVITVMESHWKITCAEEVTETFDF